MDGQIGIDGRNGGKIKSGLAGWRADGMEPLCSTSVYPSV